MYSIDWPVWIQAAAATATAWLAFESWKSGRKIKTLTDVVVKLTEQNRISQEQFEYQKDLTLPSRFPFWNIKSIFRGPEKIEIHLTNSGQPSSPLFVSYKPQEMSAEEVDPFDESKDPNKFRFRIIPLDKERYQKLKYNYEILVFYRDQHGMEMNQIIVIGNMQQYITKPIFTPRN